MDLSTYENTRSSASSLSEAEIAVTGGCRARSLWCPEIGRLGAVLRPHGFAGNRGVCIRSYATHVMQSMVCGSSGHGVHRVPILRSVSRLCTVPKSHAGDGNCSPLVRG